MFNSLHRIYRDEGDGGAAPATAPAGNGVADAIAEAGGSGFAPNWDGGNPAVVNFVGGDQAADASGAAPATAGTGAAAEPAADAGAADTAALAAAAATQAGQGAAPSAEDIAAWLPIIEQIKKEGFPDPAAVQAGLAAQQQRAAQAEEQAILDKEFDRLQALVYSEQITVAQADAEMALAVRARQVEADAAVARRDRAMYAEWRSGQELETAKAQFPNMDPDTVRQLHQATGKPIAELAKASHDYRKGIEDAAIARYQGQKAATAAAPPPEGAQGNAPAVAANAGSKPWTQSYRDLFGIGRTG